MIYQSRKQYFSTPRNDASSRIIEIRFGSFALRRQRRSPEIACSLVHQKFQLHFREESPARHIRFAPRCDSEVMFPKQNSPQKWCCSHFEISHEKLQFNFIATALSIVHNILFHGAAFGSVPTTSLVDSSGERSGGFLFRLWCVHLPGSALGSP